MTDTKAQLLEVIGALCDRYPDWRFGQLVSNIAGWADTDIWDVEDQDLLAAVRNFFSQAGTTDGRVVTPQAATAR